MKVTANKKINYSILDHELNRKEKIHLPANKEEKKITRNQQNIDLVRIKNQNNK